MLSLRVRADLALVLCTLIWGATFVVVKDALAEVSVFVFLAVRFGLAALLLAAIFWPAVKAIDRRTLRGGVEIGLAMFAGFIFQTIGLRFTTPSNAAFITGCCVVLVPLMLAIRGERRTSAWIWTAASVTLAGLYFMTVPRAGLGALNRGDPIVFVCAVMFALQIIFISRHAANHSTGALSFLQVATGAAVAWVLLPVSAILKWEQPRVTWDRNVVFAVVATAIGATVIGFSLQTWAQRHTSASHAAILFSLEPVFAAVFSIGMGREHLSARAIGGAALILAGILLAELKSPSPALPESTA